MADIAGDMFSLENVPGLVQPGTLGDPLARPIVPNPQTGGRSTEWSFSIGTDQGEVLLPRVVNGQVLTEQQAIEHFKKTGEHLGVFATPDYANAYARQLHDLQAKRK